MFASGPRPEFEESYFYLKRTTCISFLLLLHICSSINVHMDIPGNLSYHFIRCFRFIFVRCKWLREHVSSRHRDVFFKFCLYLDTICFFFFFKRVFFYITERHLYSFWWLAHDYLSTMLFKLNGSWIAQNPWSPSSQIFFLYYSSLLYFTIVYSWVVYLIYLQIQKNENAWFFFSFSLWTAP